MDCISIPNMDNGYTVKQPSNQMHHEFKTHLYHYDGDRDFEFPVTVAAEFCAESDQVYIEQVWMHFEGFPFSAVAFELDGKFEEGLIETAHDNWPEELSNEDKDPYCDPVASDRRAIARNAA